MATKGKETPLTVTVSDLKLYMESFDKSGIVVPRGEESMAILKKLFPKSSEDQILRRYQTCEKVNGISDLSFVDFMEVFQMETVLYEYDNDGSGKITPKELLDVMLKVFTNMDKMQAEKRVKKFDTDKDGSLDYDEFLKFYLVLLQQKRNIEKYFELGDKDGDGYLSMDEANKVMDNDLYAGYGLAFMYDTDSDGKISREEFRNIFYEYMIN